MFVEEFKEQCKRTCPDLGGEKLNLAHMVLGINTEILELRQAYEKRDKINIGEELADIMWYLCNYTSIRGISFPIAGAELNPGELSTSFLYNKVAELQDIIKKYIAYNRPIDVKREMVLIANIYGFISESFLSIDGGIGMYLQRNIDKLKVRFPDKFNDDDANNRDLSKERQILEGNYDH